MQLMINRRRGEGMHKVCKKIQDQLMLLLTQDEQCIKN